MYGKGKMPSMEKIQDGIIKEALGRVEEERGESKNKQKALENVKVTWQGILEKAQVDNMEEPFR